MKRWQIAMDYENVFYWKMAKESVRMSVGDAHKARELNEAQSIANLTIW